MDGPSLRGNTRCPTANTSGRGSGAKYNTPHTRSVNTLKVWARSAEERSITASRWFKCSVHLVKQLRALIADAPNRDDPVTIDAAVRSLPNGTAITVTASRNSSSERKSSAPKDERFREGPSWFESVSVAGLEVTETCSSA